MKVVETGKVTKPDAVKDEIWESNQRWLKLMIAQAEQHRRTRDPRLYRHSTDKRLIQPIRSDDA